jgi:hypothetical protein
MLKDLAENKTCAGLINAQRGSILRGEQKANHKSSDKCRRKGPNVNCLACEFLSELCGLLLAAFAVKSFSILDRRAPEAKPQRASN